VPIAILYCILLFLAFEWIQRRKQHAMQVAGIPRLARWTVYLGVIFLIFLYGNFNKTEFIYFAF
jgi:alginate O-acetyltransferase complex protein AlgI